MEATGRVTRRISTHLLEICAFRALPGHASHRSTCPDGQFWLSLSGSFTVRGEAGNWCHRPQQLAYYAPREGAVRIAEEEVRAFGIQIRLPRLMTEEQDPRWRQIGHQPWEDYVRALKLLRAAHGPTPDLHHLDEMATEWVHQALPLVNEAKIPRWMRRAEEMVAANPEIPLAEVARSVGVVPAYLSAQYRRQMGVPLSRFRRRTMLQRALSLQSAMPLAQAAIEAGFYDVSHFHRVCQAELESKPTELTRWMHS